VLGRRYEVGVCPNPRARRAPSFKEAINQIDGPTGKIIKTSDQPFEPNGPCFSSDYKRLYVADTGRSHCPGAKPIISAFDVDGATLKNPRTSARMELDGKTGLADGICRDGDGNVWASAGWVGDG
jgi:gluconolactonase